MPCIIQSRLRSARLVAPRAARAGFTLIEVLVVVAIIGIAGAVVVPQMLSSGRLQIQAASRMVIADLLYAQNDAIAHQTSRSVVYDTTTNSYKVTDATGTALAVSWKNDAAANYVINFSQDSRFNGVTLSSPNFGGTSTIQFDALGTPSSGGTVDLVAGSTTYRVTVGAFTGRVTVAPVSGG